LERWNYVKNIINTMVQQEKKGKKKTPFTNVKGVYV